jgi:hypothetical protein
MAIHFSPSVSCPSQKKAKCAPRQSNKWVKHKGDWTSFLTENSFTHMRDVTGAERERERGRERKREREWDREEANDLKLQLNAYLHMINKLPKMYRQLSFWPFMMNVAFLQQLLLLLCNKTGTISHQKIGHVQDLYTATWTVPFIHFVFYSIPIVTSLWTPEDV